MDNAICSISLPQQHAKAVTLRIGVHITKYSLTRKRDFGTIVYSWTLAELGGGAPRRIQIRACQNLKSMTEDERLSRLCMLSVHKKRMRGDTKFIDNVMNKFGQQPKRLKFLF